MDSVFGWRRANSAGRLVVMLIGLFGLSACYTPPPPPYPGLPRLSVTTRFGVENLCDAGLSPQITLSGVPDGTASYVVQISDIMVLMQTPWRETIPLTSKAEIPEGAAKTYDGPCLGDMTRFVPTTPYGYQHRVEVLAQDAQGRPLAYGSTIVWVESPYVTAKRERLRLQQPGANTAPPPTTGFPAGAGYGLPGYGMSPTVNFNGGLSPGTSGLGQ